MTSTLTARRRSGPSTTTNALTIAFEVSTRDRANRWIQVHDHQRMVGIATPDASISPNPHTISR
jgi:hypothetical protein